MTADLGGKTVADADVSAYDGLALPGDVVNPYALRTDAAAVALVEALVEALAG